MPASNEEIREGLSILFENFWIIRETDKDVYHQLLRIENDLKRVTQRIFGLRLIVHAKFIKLEKIPFESQDWMGIDFQRADGLCPVCLRDGLYGG